MSPWTVAMFKPSRSATIRSCASCAGELSRSVTRAPAAARIGACCPPADARHRTSSPLSSGNHAAGTGLLGVSNTCHSPSPRGRDRRWGHRDRPAISLGNPDIPCFTIVCQHIHEVTPCARGRRTARDIPWPWADTAASAWHRSGWLDLLQPTSSWISGRSTRYCGRPVGSRSVVVCVLIPRLWYSVAKIS